MDPYSDAVKRQAQIGELRGSSPVSNTMPVRGNSQGDFLQHASRFSPNPSGLQSLMGDEQFRQRFPSARVHKNDWVDLGDGAGLIDSIEAFDATNNTGKRWQYLTEADAIGSKAAEGGLARPGVNPQALMAADNSSLTRIMAELTAASEGNQSPAEREALLAMLQGI